MPVNPFFPATVDVTPDEAINPNAPGLRIAPVTANDEIAFDLLQTPLGLIDETQQLASAILIALNTDKLADPSDVLPDPRDSDRRGWWGDLDAHKIWNGWPIGSKLWLLSRDKIVGSGARAGATTARVEAYIREALKPFIDQKLCSKITVAATIETSQRISALITLYRGPKKLIELEYQPLWDEIFPGS